MPPIRIDALMSSWLAYQEQRGEVIDVFESRLTHFPESDAEYLDRVMYEGIVNQEIARMQREGVRNEK